MDAATAAALVRINRTFYERHAAEFSARRERPWPGWRRVAELVEERRGGSGGAPLSVLDLGCGNGRLADELERRWRRRFDYLGVDSSGALLDIARRRAARRPGRRFLHRDLYAEGPPAKAAGRPFDLVAAFGLLHHLPGQDRRAAFLERAAELTAPGGVLAVAFWQFGDNPRMRRRIVPWEVYNHTAGEPVDPAALEEGDYLLAWGERRPGEPPPVRYCHWTRPAEAARLLAGLRSVASFGDDGDNLYEVRLGSAV